MSLKNCNNRSKKEQFFILLLICVGMFSVLCITGCKGERCRDCGAGCYNKDGVNAIGVSLLGPGGVISPRKGCGYPAGCKSIGYVNSCKCNGGKWNQNKGDDNKQNGCIISCGQDWYGSGACTDNCDKKNDKYCGCIYLNNTEESMTGCFCTRKYYDDNNGTYYSGEEICGWYNGCGACCTETKKGAYNKVHELQELEGIE